MRRLAAAMVLAVLAAPASSDEVAELCFNYGCATTAQVRFTPADLARVQALFVDVKSPVEERESIAQAMAWMYFYAGQQSPVWRDRGGNIEDDGVEGRMDCIDHSTNSTHWLEILSRYGWLRFHEVAPPIRRGRLLWVHWSARVVETSANDEYVVDTWFLDPGHPAVIYPVPEWLDGARPSGTEIVRWGQ